MPFLPFKQKYQRKKKSFVGHAFFQVIFDQPDNLFHLIRTFDKNSLLDKLNIGQTELSVKEKNYKIWGFFSSLFVWGQRMEP